ncbi:MAG: hypothetical protein GX418_06580 [Clostridiales bacterium]|nr:hypothetical protein [Clostridiales bacterium]
MVGFLEQTFVLRAADTDARGEWRPGSMFLAMQEAGGAQSESLGIGMTALRERNLAWVINRARLHLTRAPRIGQTVTLRTWPKTPQHFFFPRYYQFWADGQPVGAASTLYVQLDLTARRMAKPWLCDHTELNCDLEPPLPLPGGIPALDAPAETFGRVARYSDLDINGHVNNARYLDWFGDCFDHAAHGARALEDLLIHYNREIRPDEAVTLTLRNGGATSVLKGECDGAPCFAIGAQWRERR